MKTSGLSIRAILGLIIIMMGVMAFVLALLSGYIHRDLIFDNQQAMMEDMIGIEVKERLRDLTAVAQNLGLALQSLPEFESALNFKDKDTLQKLLNNQFHQYFVTAGVIKLDQLIVLGKDFDLVTESTNGSVDFTRDNKKICPQLLARAQLRTGSERMTIIHDLCLYDNRPLYSVLVPVGGLRLKGYLMIVTDPTHSLSRIENNLGMPVKFLLKNNEIDFKSEKWPSDETDSLISNYVLKSSTGLPILSMMTAQNINGLSQSLRMARLEVLLITGTGTLFIIVISIFVMRGAVLNPLNRLTYRLQHLHTDRSHLGEQLEVTGTREMHEITEGFNAMTLELDSLYKSLENMAYTDALTTLPNRHHFRQNLEDIIRIHRKLKKPFALLLIDLDRFKGVNDTLGHNIGDELLKAVSLRLHHSLRDSDIVSRLDEESITQINESNVARLGGDEFSVILSNINTYDDSIVVARKLVLAMEEPFAVQGHRLTASLSIGIAMYPEHGEDMHTLISHSDIAMYDAKGKNCGYALYDPALDKHSLHNLKLEQDLFASLKNDQLLLYYQPKVSLHNGVVVGAEALIRWQHPELGLVPPDEFIPLAEQTGLIQPIAEWVLNKALEDYSSSICSEMSLSVAVNLSASNFRDDRISSIIANVLNKWSIPAAALTLELTESTIMINPEMATEILTKLDQMGVSLSIDDFGTGYSSLAYIKNLPVDEIKIDKSFIKEIIQDRNNRAIVRAVLVLAHDMKLSVVAEGVEDKKTLDMLSTLGCDIVQGYYFARPMPFDEYIAWLENYQASLG